MSNDIRSLIDQEINNIDEMLAVHAYHRQALKELLAKIDTAPKENPVAKRTLPKFKSQCRVFATRVAELVRDKDLTKTGAIRELISTGDINVPLERAQAMIAPANLGKRFHNKLFKGTRYAA